MTAVDHGEIRGDHLHDLDYAATELLEQGYPDYKAAAAIAHELFKLQYGTVVDDCLPAAEEIVKNARM